ncbi:hypothetical protein CU098_010509 [Rhizopus stolonifer]|uniref:Uncharacterized protein n=2 Tax=Mucorineae TaxID=1344963 RepID=A0A367JRA8_RHIST|nr:hypothetical protein CU098_010509 [Rhizopus stolonifer]
MTATLVGLATTAYAVMSVEQTRFNGSRFLTPFMITMGNIIGTGVIAPLAWLPWYGWSLSHHHKQTHVNIMNNKLKTSSNNSDKLKERINHLKQQQFSLPSIAPNYAFSIAIATLFGQFLPVALLVSHGPSLTQHNILASFQYFGIVYGLIKLVLPSCTTGLNEKTKNSESVRLLYAGVAGINAFLYYWVWIKWLQTTTSPDLMVKQWIELFFSLGTTGENPVTYMLMWDIVALFSTFTYWAWLEDGLEGVKTMLINSVFFGPGASLAIYTLKREGRIEATKL